MLLPINEMAHNVITVSLIPELPTHSYVLHVDMYLNFLELLISNDQELSISFYKPLFYYHTVWLRVLVLMIHCFVYCILFMDVERLTVGCVIGCRCEIRHDT